MGNLQSATKQQEKWLKRENFSYNGRKCWNISFLEHSNFGTINFGTFDLRAKINRVPKLVRLQGGHSFW